MGSGSATIGAEGMERVVMCVRCVCIVRERETEKREGDDNRKDERREKTE